ncbi:hypothetical protein JCM17961_17510 [Endothiovibrio diazotrophicus]
MVLVLVLWFIATAAVFAAVMASEARLTAKAAFHNREAVGRWAATLDAVHRAEMELMLVRMPEPLKDQGPLSERRIAANRFNGQPLTTAFPLPEGVEVRVWDHAGKINLNNLSRARMEELLRTRVDDDDQVEALLDAWQDWIDGDDLERVNGAEEKYYEKLDPPYRPRNGRLESVEELRLIKGFDEVLEGIDLNAVFTIYGGNSGVNPNVASREALALLPGMDEETLGKILEARAEADLKSRVDLTDLVDVTVLPELLPWLQFATGNFYTVAVSAVPKEGEPAVGYGYQEIVQAQGFEHPPKVLQVRPFGTLPERVVVVAEGEETAADGTRSTTGKGRSDGVE